MISCILLILVLGYSYYQATHIQTQVSQINLKGLGEKMMSIKRNYCDKIEDRSLLLDKLQGISDTLTARSDRSIFFFVDDLNGDILVSREKKWIGKNHAALDSTAFGNAYPIFNNAFEGAKQRVLYWNELHPDRDSIIYYVYDYIVGAKKARIWRHCYLMYDKKHAFIMGITRFPPPSKISEDDMDYNNLVGSVFYAHSQTDELIRIVMGTCLALLVLFVLTWRSYSLNLKEKKQLEEQKRDFQRQLYAVDQASSAIAIFSDSGQVEWANETFLKWNNVPRAEIIGSYIWEVSLVPDILKKFREFVADSSLSTLEYQSSLGEKITSTKLKKYQTDESSLKIISVDSDVTELSELLEIFPHDLKSPVHGPRLRVRSLLLEDEPNVTRDELVEILEGLESAQQIGENLGYWAKTRFGRTVKRESVRVLDVVKKAVNSLRLIADHHRIEFDIQIDRDLQYQSDNSPMFRSVIRNILTNAVNAIKLKQNTDRGLLGRISVVANRVGEELYISITDNGIGLSKEEADALFSLDDGKRGWGTAVCKRYADRYGKRIYAKPVSTGGLKVSLEI